jgi:hypothetical protein
MLSGRISAALSSWQINEPSALLHEKQRHKSGAKVKKRHGYWGFWIDTDKLFMLFGAEPK